MFSLFKTLHVLAIGLWFGSGVFFTVSGVLMNKAFEEVSLKEKRPLWLPLTPPFERPPLGEGFPDPTRKEQGSRAFGVAVSRLFPFYYALQLACAGIALLTAARMASAGANRVNSWRIGLCALALATVGVGWWLETVVHEPRGPREELTDKVLLAHDPTGEQLAEARAARAEFFRWHTYSLLQNFTTLALVLVVTALAAHLPADPRT